MIINIEKLKNKLLELCAHLKRNHISGTSTTICNCCGKKYNSIEKPGALMFSTPYQTGLTGISSMVTKYHICTECEIRIVKGFKIL